MKVTILYILSVMLFSCHKPDLPKDVPSPVKKLINDFSKTSACNDAHVDEYQFQEKTVYVFDNGTCGNDMMSSVIDKEGKTIGTLGGISGSTEVNGEKFDSAIFVRSVWKKDV